MDPKEDYSKPFCLVNGNQEIIIIIFAWTCSTAFIYISAEFLYTKVLNFNIQ